MIGKICMKQRSRTEYSLINMATGIVGYGINTVVGFVCRIIFVRTLTADDLGVSGLFTNVLSMLSLAELGISSAIICCTCYIWLIPSSAISSATARRC